MKKPNPLTVIDQLDFSNAITQLDRDRIQKYFLKQDLQIARECDSVAWWAAVHTIRLLLITSTKAQLRDSETYLRMHGFPVPARPPDSAYLHAGVRH